MDKVMDKVKGFFAALYKLLFNGPFVVLLNSRKFWIIIGTAAVDLLLTQVPELEPVRDQLIASFTLLAVALVASIAHEDGKRIDAGDFETRVE